MASRQALLFAAAAVVAVACLAAPVAATEWMVGDDAGWKKQFNETGWAKDKIFRVGDTLRFMYTMGQHTVAEVGGADFRACNLQGNRLGHWNSGDDLVPLDKTGKRWFICDVPDHCNQGMKLVVDVVDAAAPPAPSPEAPQSDSSPPAGVSFFVGGAVAVAVVAAALAF